MGHVDDPHVGSDGYHYRVDDTHELVVGAVVGEEGQGVVSLAHGRCPVRHLAHVTGRPLLQLPRPPDSGTPRPQIRPGQQLWCRPWR